MSNLQKAPIAVVSFDRPNYLREVLVSLRAQEADILDNRKIFLFQDGLINRFSGRICAASEAIEACVVVFREIFPEGFVIRSSVNLGVGLHFDKIETFLFEECGYESAIFLEDDFVLCPIYLRVLDALLRQALQDPRIGYVSAVGDHLRPLESQRAVLTSPMVMRQNWAFGLTRRLWLENRPFMMEYLELIRSVDYRDRPHDKIFDLYTTWGVGRMESSQDRAKFIVTTLNRRLRLSTIPCYGKYIGRVGVHSDEAMFRSSGFELTQVGAPAIDGFDLIDDGLYLDLLGEQCAHICPPARSIEPDMVLLFVSGSSDCTSLGRGFHAPEGDGTWMAGATAVVNIAESAFFTHGEFDLIIVLKHYLSRVNEVGCVFVALDDQELGAAETTFGFKTFTFPVPQSLWSNVMCHKLTLSAKPVDCPSAHGGADARLLGACIRSIQFSRRS